jgi:hypothetical protein
LSDEKELAAEIKRTQVMLHAGKTIGLASPEADRMKKT